MRAIVLDRPGACRDAGVPDPAPRPTDIVVKAAGAAALDEGPFDAGGSPAGAAIRVPPFGVYIDEPHHCWLNGCAARLRPGRRPAQQRGGRSRALALAAAAAGTVRRGGGAGSLGPGDQMAHPAVVTGAITSWARAGG